MQSEREEERTGVEKSILTLAWSGFSFLFNKRPLDTTQLVDHKFPSKNCLLENYKARIIADIMRLGEGLR